MKKALSLVSCLLFLASTSFADTGVTKAVSKNIKSVKSVQTHQLVRDVQEMDAPDMPKEKSRTVIPFVNKTRKAAPAPRQIAPAPSKTQATTQKTVSKSAASTSSSLKTTRSSGKSGACKLTEMTYSGRYSRQLGGHLGRGLLNVLSGWIELPRTAYRRAHEDPPVITLLTGIVEGAALGILRTASGIVDIPSGLIPNYSNEMYFHDEPTIGCYA